MRSVRGYTLMELVIVIAVVSVCTVPLVTSFATALTRGVDGEFRSTATALLQREAERMMSDGFTAVTASGPTALEAPFTSYALQIEWDYVTATDFSTPVSPGPTEFKHVLIQIQHQFIGSVETDVLMTDYDDLET